MGEADKIRPSDYKGRPGVLSASFFLNFSLSDLPSHLRCGPRRPICRNRHRATNLGPRSPCLGGRGVVICDTSHKASPRYPSIASSRPVMWHPHRHTHKLYTTLLILLDSFFSLGKPVSFTLGTLEWCRAGQREGCFAGERME